MFMIRKIKNQSLNMSDILIQHKHLCYLNYFNEDLLPSDIRSSSKTIMSIVLGVAIIFLKKESIQNLVRKRIFIQSYGFNDVFLMRDDIVNMNHF